MSLVEFNGKCFVNFLESESGEDSPEGQELDEEAFVTGATEKIHGKEAGGEYS